MQWWYIKVQRYVHAIAMRCRARAAHCALRCLASCKRMRHDAAYCSTLRRKWRNVTQRFRTAPQRVATHRIQCEPTLSLGICHWAELPSSRPDGAIHVLRLLLPESCYGLRTVLFQLPPLQDACATSTASCQHRLAGIRRNSITQVIPRRFEL